MNAGYVAHIVAAEPDGPRGDATLSPQLAKELSNLMLMCDVCHRRIDREDVQGHPAERLRAMKQGHEARIELLTSLDTNRRSHVLLYGANIGTNAARVNWKQAGQAMLPENFPAEPQPIELSLTNSAYEDAEASYWTTEIENLQRLFEARIRQRLVTGEISRLSVFAIAPMPLLIKLGQLLSDIPNADVYQLHREPANWVWQDHPEDFQYSIQEPATTSPNVALIFSLSASIEDQRIFDVLGNDTAIWRVSVPTPNNDFLKSRQQLRQFRELCRRLFDQIKKRHGEAATIHLFPAVPVSIAVEIGRVWMPKADLPIRVYDQNRKLGGFTRVIDFPQPLTVKG